MQQSLKIRQWQPWQHSTGAKTIEGKANSSQNAFKHGLRSVGEIEDAKQVYDLLRSCKELLRTI